MDRRPPGRHPELRPGLPPLVRVGGPLGRPGRPGRLHLRPAAPGPVRGRPGPGRPLERPAHAPSPASLGWTGRSWPPASPGSWGSGSPPTTGRSAAVYPRAMGIRRAGSAALDLAHTACGIYDGFFELGLKPWDLAAGDPAGAGGRRGGHRLAGGRRLDGVGERGGGRPGGGGGVGPGGDGLHVGSIRVLVQDLPHHPPGQPVVARLPPGRRSPGPGRGWRGSGPGRRSRGRRYFIRAHPGEHLPDAPEGGTEA